MHMQKIFSIETQPCAYIKNTINTTVPEVYSEPSQPSKMELFGKIVNGFQSLTIFTKKLDLRCLTGF